jgi:hypothetical protein
MASYDAASTIHQSLLFGGGGKQFGIQLTAVIVIALWTCTMSGRGLHSSTFQLTLSRFGHTSPCPPV